MPFTECEICGTRDWTIVYEGPIRDGVFGNLVDGAIVARCGGCGAERLDERFCPDERFYETEAYRRTLRQELDADNYFATHDVLQIFALKTLWPRSLRGKTVADIGCAGGSFLDHVASVAERIVAVEPCTVYHGSLNERGYAVFAYAADAAQALPQKIDVAVSLQVIEHVANPREFLQSILPLLADDGVLLLSTPNRHDVLMDLLPDDFPGFFYRVVHRWYFDAPALAICAERAGFEIIETRHVHRYGLSNALVWLRDRRPSGHCSLDVIDALADNMWKGWLEANGRSDSIYVLLRRRRTHS